MTLQPAPLAELSRWLSAIYGCEDAAALREMVVFLSEAVYSEQPHGLALGHLLREHLHTRARRLEEDNLEASLHTLTRREQEILMQLSLGASDAQMAQSLGIMRKTASKHVENILRKLHVETRGAAVATYINALQSPW